MQVQHTAYLLKVLTGANAGAVVRLKTGGIIIGRSMVCDIILHDENIADEHIRINVDEESIKLQPIALPVFLDGEELGMRAIDLKPYQVVSLGKVEFFIEDPRLEDNQARIGHLLSERETGGQRVNEPINRKKSKSSNAFDLNNKSYLWLGLLLLVLANLVFFAPSLMSFIDRMGLSSTPDKQVTDIASELNNDSLKVSSSEGGNTMVSGYVKTLAEKNDVLSRLTGVGGNVIPRIWVESELAQNAEMIAHTLGERAIHFRPGNRGEVEAFGFVSNAQDWGRVKASIMDDIIGITAIDESDLQTLLKRMEALQQFIEKNDLSTRIRVAIEQGSIKVSGELTKGEIDRWNDLYSEFIATYGEGPSIIENLYDARDRIKLSIRSVSIGETPYLVSKDGKKYLEGASLGNGYFIKAIRPDYILLVNNGIEIPIYYGAEEQ